MGLYHKNSLPLNQNNDYISSSSDGQFEEGEIQNKTEGTKVADIFKCDTNVIKNNIMPIS